MSTIITIVVIVNIKFILNGHDGDAHLSLLKLAFIVAIVAEIMTKEPPKQEIVLPTLLLLLLTVFANHRVDDHETRRDWLKVMLVLLYITLFVQICVLISYKNGFVSTFHSCNDASTVARSNRRSPETSVRTN